MGRSPRADFETASRLAERVLREKLKWLNDLLEDDVLAACPLWSDIGEGQRFLAWKDLKGIADGLDVVNPPGFIDGESPKPDARAARRALLVIQRLVDKELKSPCDGVILVRDDDGDEQRREGLEQARRASRWDRPIVLGVAHTKRECWVLAGFQPKDEEEKKLLKDLVLGFDPLEEAHKLTASHDDDKNSAKRVLNILTNSDWKRERECWEDTDLDLLRTRGKKTGLSEYLSEVEDRLVPRLEKPP